MKNLFITVFILFSIMTGSVSYSNSVSNKLTPAAQTAYMTPEVPTEDYITIRVQIDGWWWTYYYALNGSFIVAIPDDEE